jgi:rhomboid protease GluP
MAALMFERQRSGSVLCPSCGQLVGVNDERCLHCGRRNPGMWGFASLFRALGRDMGFVPLVVGACGLVYVLTLVVDPSQIRMDGLFGLLGPGTEAVFMFGASGALPVFGYDRWWTVLSAGWLHAGLLHILFNMMWVRDLGGAAVQLYGPGRTAILYTLSSVTGFLASSTAGRLPLPGPLAGGQLTLGASAAIFGLLGALVYYGRRTGSSHIGGSAKSYALILGLIGFVLPGVDNWAHLGGFAGGYVGSRVMDPMTPERGNHVLLGVACLLASAVSILVSVLHYHRIAG